MPIRTFGLTVLLAGALALGLPAGVGAHPSYAMYRMDIEMVLEGVVKSFDYAIPHSWLQLTVTGEDGTTQDWALEMEGVPALFQQGIKQDYVAPGDLITVRIHPMRGNRPAGLWRGSIDAEGNAFGDTEGLEPPAQG